MSKHDADKTTGLPPITATRFQLPDNRLSEPQLSQEDRKKAIYQKTGTGKTFGKVGIVGPR